LDGLTQEEIDKKIEEANKINEGLDIPEIKVGEGLNIFGRGQVPQGIGFYGTFEDKIYELLKFGYIDTGFGAEISFNFEAYCNFFGYKTFKDQNIFSGDYVYFNELDEVKFYKSNVNF
jgi:hypothetical protein